MKKRGVSHVDWAISMGIFLVFIMLTIIFLRPGTEQVYRGDVLLGIVEEGLRNNASFSLDKGFLVISPKLGIASGEYKIRIRNPTQEGFNHNWKENKEHLGLVDSDLNFVSYDLVDEYCPNPGCFEDVLDVESSLLADKKNVFWFVYSEGMDYSQYTDTVDIDSISEPEAGCFGTGGCLLEGEDFNYGFGVVEVQKGFSSKKLEELVSKDYETLKEKWGIPKDKNFKVIVEQQGAEPYSINEEGVAPPQVNIFAKEKQDWILTEKGERTPVKVIISIW